MQFSIQKYTATEGDPGSMAWRTTGHSLSYRYKLCLNFAKTAYSQEQGSTLLKVNCDITEVFLNSGRVCHICHIQFGS